MAAPREATLAWGILGTGHIAHIFARGIAASETGMLVAVGSRTQESADQFGDAHAVGRRYPSYAAVLADPDVQVVYIALPNNLHAEWIVKCAEAGKHILCEKPLTANYAEAMVVLEEVRRHDVFLMEAFMYRCHPQTARLKELVDDGVIGDVRLIQASFSHNYRAPYENIRLSNSAAGGGIMDVGGYTTSMVRLIVGAEPDRVTGAAHIGASTRVDEWASGGLHFPNGIVGSLICGIQVPVESAVQIWGTEGHITVPNPWFPGKGANRILIQKIEDSAPMEIVVEGENDVYAIEADTVARYIADRQAPRPAMSWVDSLGNMAVLDAWRRATGVIFDLEKPAALHRPAPQPRPDAPMTYARIPGIDRPVSRLVMGSMIYAQRDLPTACVMLDYFVSLGGNTIDTAHIYGGGEAERAVGEWMRLRGNRAEVVIVGKGAAPDARGPRRVTPTDITSDLRDSLQRLGTDYIDLYLLHRDDPAVPVGELVECLNEHYRAGRIRAFGGSNWTVGRLEAANDYAREHGLAPFAASSPNFSLAVMNEPPWPGCLSASIDGKEWYIAHQFPLLAWSSQAQGFFTGRYVPDDHSNPEMVRCWYSADNFERLERARELGRRKGVSANVMALAYVLAQPFPTFALIGPHTIEETRTSAEALGVTLTPEDLRWLNLE